MQTPTLGCVVLAANLNPQINNGATDAPAIITRVWSEQGDKWCVNVKVIADGQPDFALTSIYLYADAAAAEADPSRPTNESGITLPFVYWPPKV